MVSNNLIKGLAIGGLVGAGAAVLFAPKSGKETREQIRHTAEEVLEKAKAQYEEAASKVKSLNDSRIKRALDAGVAAYKKDPVAKEDPGCMTGLYGDNSLI